MNPSDLRTQFVEIPTAADGSTVPVSPSRMSSSPMSASAAAPATGNEQHGELSEVLPGYVLEQRLGAGGYGEVWRASAPGGLTKAVKILHGDFDGPQAETELKSLQRVREVRHPFLLNLERIEVARGRLVIVTELAEGSLEDRFADCTAQGQPGIPRDELLGYLRDAADALDFMLSRHSLQHLDVKPDNILLQGGHAKLADFGLTKELSQTNVSLVGAFTPLYAPPELYEGNPSASSDQYSLAIVYQTMLTGAAPFTGRTAAQLASQHLSSLPDLSMLPSADRPAVARALSKNPKARFGSCREFVEDLAARARTADRKTSSGSVARPKPATARTPIGEGRSDTTKLVQRSDAQPLAPPAELQTVAHGPCLIVALGGWAGRVLAKLRARTASRFGDEMPLPAVPLLAIDSDRQSLGAAARGAHGFTLHDSETLAIPLRSPQEYRDGDGNVVEWLSRRWLYNIPRSREVERFRPLGRLALVDHARAVRARLATALTEATVPGASAATGAATGLHFDPECRRVLIVASIDGGTGSGAVLDLAYLAQDVLNEFGGGRVEGLLIHGTGLRDDDRDLATANALACLAELERFTSPAGYPGDRGCGLPPTDRPPFDLVHVVHAGDDLDDAGFDQATQDIAEAIFRDRFTAAGRYFETIRQSPSTTESDAEPDAESEPMVRTIGAATLHGGTEPVDEQTIDALARGLLRNWQGLSRIEPGPRRSGDAEAAEWAAATLGELQLRSDQLLDRAMGVLRGEWGRQVDAYFRRRADEINKGSRAGVSLWAAVDIEFDDSDDGSQGGGSGIKPGQPWAVVERLRDELNTAARDAAIRFRGHLFALIDQSPRHLDAAAEAVAEFRALLDESRSAVSGVLDELAEEMNALRAAPAPSSSSPALPGGLDSPVYQYALLRFCEHTYRCMLRHASAVAALLKTLPDELRLLRQDLRSLESHLPAGAATAARETEADALSLAAFDQRVRTGGRLRLAAVLAEETDPADAVARLRDEARLFLMLQPSGVAPGQVDSTDPSDPSASVEGRLGEAARPRLSRLGGGRRVLAVVPDESQAPQWRSKLVELYGDCVTVLTDPSGGLFIACEDQDIRLSAIRPALCEHRIDLAEMAARLHTRIDIEW